LSSRGRAIALLVLAVSIGLGLHSVPVLLWHIRFESELSSLADAEAMHAEMRDDFPEPPEAWTELRLENFTLRAPLRADQSERCQECSERCLLRFEQGGTIAIFDAPPLESYSDALDRFTPDVGDISFFRSPTRNWSIIDGLTSRVRNTSSRPETYRFHTPNAKGVVQTFRVGGIPRYVVYAYDLAGRPARVLGIAGVENSEFEQILGGLHITADRLPPDGEVSETSFCGAPNATPRTNDPRETVVLLHGLARSSKSMSLLENALFVRDFRVINIDYPSTEHGIDDLVNILENELERCCKERSQPVHFVTHSLGGILVRAYLARETFEPLGRVVMLSPPNQGSELVDAFGDSPIYELILGPAGRELGTNEASVPRALPPVEFELGIITGDETINPIGAWLIPGENDGAVSVESAQVAGMSELIVLPENHTFIMQSPEAVEQVVHFIEHGQFSPRPD
jgi:hypothetical protein